MGFIFWDLSEGTMVSILPDFSRGIATLSYGICNILFALCILAQPVYHVTARYCSPLPISEKLLKGKRMMVKIYCF